MPLDLENKQSFDAVQVNSWLKLNSLSLPSLFFNYVLEVANNNKKKKTKYRDDCTTNIVAYA